MSSSRALELRIYRIHHGRRPEFIARMRDYLVPLFKRHGIEVVYYGPSLHDADSFILMRSYATVDERQKLLDTVYSGAEWLVSHEEDVLGMIESYDTAVLAADEWSIDVIKEAFEKTGSPAELARATE